MEGRHQEDVSTCSKVHQPYENQSILIIFKKADHKEELNGKEENMDLRAEVAKAVEQYNRYHSPEAVARILRVSDSEFELEFSGPFCQSCGIQDYFEDIIYELESVSDIKASVENAMKAEGNSYRVKYSVCSN